MRSNNILTPGVEGLPVISQVPAAPPYCDSRILCRRYLSSVDACWRLLGNELQGRSHGVVRLAFHLPQAQLCYYNAHDDLQQHADVDKDTMLTAFFKLNERDHEANTTLYLDIPETYVWNQGNRVRPFTCCQGQPKIRLWHHM